jgi:hypothetical protein
LDGHETEEDEEGGTLEDEDGIAEQLEGQSIIMAGQRSHIELAVIADRRCPALGDVLPHERRDSIIAGHHSGGGGEKGDAEDDRKQQDKEEGGRLFGQFSRSSELKPTYSRIGAIDSQPQPRDKGEQIMNREVSQGGEIVLKPEDNKGDVEKVLKETGPTAEFLIQFVDHYIREERLFQSHGDLP